MLAARFVRLIATLLAVSFLTFFLVNTLPGDPINALIPPDAQQDREFVEQLREEYGLNDPFIVRYGSWLGDAINGDLGRSVITDQLVTDEIKHRIPVTAELAVVSIGIALLLAIPLGVTAGYRQGSRVDQSISAIAQFLLSIPSFNVGLILIYFLSLRLPWLAATG